MRFSNFTGFLTFPTTSRAPIPAAWRLKFGPRDAALLDIVTHNFDGFPTRTQHPVPISYATTAYFGVNAMTFTDRHGRTRPVRYRFVPAAGEHYFSATSGPTANYLQPEIARCVAAGPIRFDWYAQLGEPGDLLDDPSVARPDAGRHRAGRSDACYPCRSLSRIVRRAPVAARSRRIRTG